MEEFKINYKDLRGEEFNHVFRFPIGHICRPSAFSKPINCKFQKNLRDRFKNENLLKQANDFEIESLEDCKNQEEQLSTISSEEDQSPQLKATPSFNPQISDIARPKESKEEIIEEFMSNLKAPSEKPRQEKPATRILSGYPQNSTYIVGNDSPFKNYVIEVGTNPSELDFSPAYQSKFTHTSKPRVGIYSPEVRKAKIHRYRAKIQKWLRGEHKNKNLYYKRRAIAKNKKRIGGKFIKQVM
ncbi:unnamed protein product [Moneuplotes crassus]|uniref:CCT domain-containing protein n=1 Tax=Euplotes crassus TaxID=5936 RepID=A0AAD1XN94_EUPCR|nr:unnamed protein product [Moneuplotes crassus]